MINVITRKLSIILKIRCIRQINSTRKKRKHKRKIEFTVSRATIRRFVVHERYTYFNRPSDARNIISTRKLDPSNDWRLLWCCFQGRWCYARPGRFVHTDSLPLHPFLVSRALAKPRRSIQFVSFSPVALYWTFYERQVRSRVSATLLSTRIYDGALRRAARSTCVKCARQPSRIFDDRLRGRNDARTNSRCERREFIAVVREKKGESHSPRSCRSFFHTFFHTRGDTMNRKCSWIHFFVSQILHVS